MRDAIMQAIEKVGAIAPQDLVLALADYPEKDVRRWISRLIDEGSLGVDMDWNLGIGDGEPLWP